MSSTNLIKDCAEWYDNYNIHMNHVFLLNLSESSDKHELLLSSLTEGHL